MWVVGYGKTNGKFYVLSIHCIAMQKEQALETISKRACLLNPNQISELIMDNHTDESLCDAVSKEDEEYCEEVLLASHLRWQSKYAVCFSAQAQIRPNSANTSEDDDIQIGSYPQTQQPPKSQWTLPSLLQQSVVHTFTGGSRGQNDSGASHSNDGSAPLSVAMLYFTDCHTACCAD